ARASEKGRRDRRRSRPRADALRRLAVQGQGDRLLKEVGHPERSEGSRTGNEMSARADIFHPAFKAQPWWWEAWTPNNALSQDPPGKPDVAIVGAGYGGL